MISSCQGSSGRTAKPRLRTRMWTRLAGDGAVLRNRHVATIALASLVARLPFSVMGLATVFYVQGQTGSFAVAGVAVGAFSLASGALAPLRGRLVNRRGMRRGLLPLGLAHAAATAAFLPVGAVHGADALFVVVAAGGGATAPPVNAAMRSLWPSLVNSEQLDAAYSIEAVLQEIGYLAGPLLAGILISIFSTGAPIAVSAILTAVGVSFFATHRTAREWAPASAPPQSPLRSCGIRTIVAALATGSVALGVLEVVVPAFSEGHGTPTNAGALFSVMSAGSIVGGVWYGLRRWKISALKRFIAASAVAAAAYASTIAATSVPVFGLGLIIFGVTLAPSLAAVYSILDDVAPAGTAVESVTWITTATAGGAAIGAAVAGAVVQRVGIQPALILGTASMVLATMIPILWRNALQPASRALEPASPQAEPSVR